MDPHAKAILHTLPDDRRQRSTMVGVVLFTVCLCAWMICVLTVALAPIWLSVFASIVSGFAISTLFIVGHDACHGSLVPSRRLNRIIATLAFLPALHPFSTWKRNHNGMHHVWTNLKHEDPGYAPWSFDEFRRLPLIRRLMERVYRTRTTAGLGLFYFVEVWCKYQIFPGRAHGPANQHEFQRDRLLVTVFLIGQCAGMYLMASVTNRPSPVLFTIFAIVAPYAVFFSLMGFVTFQHHTHPEIPWFDQREEWTYFQGQVRGTTHIQFPRFCDVILLNILEHSAHHVDPLIPLYRLPESQNALEDAYPQTVKIIAWNPLVLWKTLSCCKLYDYEQHRWLDFAGKPTTARQYIAGSSLAPSCKDHVKIASSVVACDLVPSGVDRL
ncbi:fatty acid desaturase [Schlesneria paludicola]|uniref:fatty acid desaturase n=1 Tax=Schlesneria paludicola TaxID=360056 RepID=UPI00029A8C38|nr:fatty acid desaturase [Schlesneria paludicola]